MVWFQLHNSFNYHNFWHKKSNLSNKNSTTKLTAFVFTYK